jgi:hypothetical protein
VEKNYKLNMSKSDLGGVAPLLNGEVLVAEFEKANRIFCSQQWTFPMIDSNTFP